MKTNISLLRHGLLVLTLSLLAGLLLGCGNDQPPKVTSAFPTMPVTTRIVMTTPTTIPKIITAESNISTTEMVGLSLCLLILFLFVSYMVYRKKQEKQNKLV